MTSRNAAVQEWQAYLTNRARRHRDGRFLIQGAEPITQAVAHGWPLEALLYRLGGPELPPWARELIDTSAVPSVGLVPEVMAELGETPASTPELVAVARVREPALDGFAPGGPGDAPVVVVVERPGSAVRLGSLIRTAHAFGAAAVVVSGSGADPYDPQCVRTSAGALFALPVFRVPGVAAVRRLRDRQAGRGLSTLVVGVVEAPGAVPRPRDGTHPDPARGGSRPVDAHDFTNATIVVIADETELGASWQRACDALVHIPAAGTLAAPCAAATALYEIFRQRRML
ncbi:TrmH family RNA methyltransferase [Nocardia mexicana]|uniref:TrmH family RNA methyltransferase n=1 Tax=Nocardia mexicana TaxID=279262 RepID=A0A370GJB9_9NOCA|nr:TrmH family RNA methyltransferase [Nocardia mexicana]RDI42494.1 TrmH family RNA methyltransferase [Nocardia mexicana]